MMLGQLRWFSRAFGFLRVVVGGRPCQHPRVSTEDAPCGAHFKLLFKINIAVRVGVCSAWICGAHAVSPW